ncbi:MAG: hypothetical protein KKH94_10720 [Candidatus Omnitrophica bacterium]|nr:hypothetical protein [Candidatus Omnitrophota bacterium]
MTLGPLKVFAGILIIFAVIKTVVVLRNPQAWFNFAKKLYRRPPVTQAAALVLAAIVLCFLMNAGMTMIHILAVMVFIMLLMLVGMAPYGEQLINWVQGQDIKKMMKGMWLYMAVWIVLLLWGIKEIILG